MVLTGLRVKYPQRHPGPLAPCALRFAPPATPPPALRRAPCEMSRVGHDLSRVMLRVKNHKTPVPIELSRCHGCTPLRATPHPLCRASAAGTWNLKPATCNLQRPWVVAPLLHQPPVLQSASDDGGSTPEPSTTRVALCCTSCCTFVALSKTQKPPANRAFYEFVAHVAL